MKIKLLISRTNEESSTTEQEQESGKENQETEGYSTPSPASPEAMVNSSFPSPPSFSSSVKFPTECRTNINLEEVEGNATGKENDETERETDSSLQKSDILKSSESGERVPAWEEIEKDDREGGAVEGRVNIKSTEQILNLVSSQLNDFDGSLPRQLQDHQTLIDSQLISIIEANDNPDINEDKAAVQLKSDFEILIDDGHFNDEKQKLLHNTEGNLDDLFEGRIYLSLTMCVVS